MRSITKYVAEKSINTAQKSLLAIVTLNLLFCIDATGQIGEFYRFQEPRIQIYLPDGWGFLEESRGELKFVSHSNGVIGSILRVKNEKTDLLDVWNIDDSEARKPYSSEVQLKNFKLDRVKILGTKAIKMSFNCNLGGKSWMGLVYNSVITDNRTSYLNTLFFLVPEILQNEDLPSANRITDSYFNNIGSKIDKRIVKDIVIPRPKDYDYFDQSVYQEMTIYDFTKSKIATDEVVNFDLLVPEDLSSPFVHIYSQQRLFDTPTAQSEFNNFKNYWKTVYQNGSYDILAEAYFKQNILPNIQRLNSKIGWAIIKESDKVLTIQTFVEGNMNDQVFLRGVISNFLLLENRKVVFIKTNMEVISTDDYNQLTEFNDSFIENFTNEN